MAVSKPSKPSKPRKSFPGAGIDLVEHELTIDMFQVLPTRKSEKLVPLESLKFSGRMTLEREEPRLVTRGVHKGKNQIRFTVRTWVASTFSKVLGMEILYILADDIEQKPGTITAEQEGEDYPATFDFNVIFDVRANNRIIKRRHHGKPAGDGFLTVPPNGNRRQSPTITRFESTFVQLKHPMLGLLRFVPRDCNDNSGRTVINLDGAIQHRG